MINDVGNIIVELLKPYKVGGTGDNQFIDKLAGVVKTITKTDQDKDNRTIRKTFPVSCDTTASDCFSSGRYKDLIPDSSIGCMVYLEAVSNQYLGNTGRKNNWKAQYRLVSWINQKKLGFTDCSITAQIITTFINSFPENPFNSGIYQTCRINVIAQDHKDFNPFAKYSYDEDKTQYLMYPFDYFSLQMTVDYQIDKFCLTPFTKEEAIPC